VCVELCPCNLAASRPYPSTIPLLSLLVQVRFGIKLFHLDTRSCCLCLGTKEKLLGIFASKHKYQTKSAPSCWQGRDIRSQIDDVLYSNPSFWCKSLPECPDGAGGNACTELKTSSTSPHRISSHGSFDCRADTSEQTTNAATFVVALPHVPR
jgi:hypothetical protein